MPGGLLDSCLFCKHLSRFVFAVNSLWVSHLCVINYYAAISRQRHYAVGVINSPWELMKRLRTLLGAPAWHIFSAAATGTPLHLAPKRHQLLGGWRRQTLHA